MFKYVLRDPSISSRLTSLLAPGRRKPDRGVAAMPQRCYEKHRVRDITHVYRAGGSRARTALTSTAG